MMRQEETENIAVREMVARPRKIDTEREIQLRPLGGKRGQVGEITTRKKVTRGEVEADIRGLACLGMSSSRRENMGDLMKGLHTEVAALALEAQVDEAGQE